MNRQQSLIVAAAILNLAQFGHAGAAQDPVAIREWPVPWENTRPRDPYVAADGMVWFVGQQGHYVARLDPDNGEFSRFDLESGTGPHNLVVSDNNAVWYAGNLKKHIGRLDPSTGLIDKVLMPDDEAWDPHTLAFDSAGDIWFTVQHGNFVGSLSIDDRDVRLRKVPTARARPYGIVINSQDVPWVVEFGSNKLLRIDPADMSLHEITLPDSQSRPRRLVVTSDDNIWYADYALGRLGRYEPREETFSEWPMPGGADSRPYAMAADRHDRIWLVETGPSPNRLTGFDPDKEQFFSVTDIPSGGGAVRHMYYFEPKGEIWFGTDTNTIGRATVH